jgi:hypothetical protein
MSIGGSFCGSHRSASPEHLTAAGDTERAVDQWLKAGQYPAERSAHPEAISHFDRGPSVLAALPVGPPRDEQEIELQLARGVSLLVGQRARSARGRRMPIPMFVSLPSGAAMPSNQARARRHRTGEPVSRLGMPRNSTRIAPGWAESSAALNQIVLRALDN